MKQLSLLLCLCTSSIYSEDYKYKLSICSIFRDEATYIPEWIEFHQGQGVEHFYLYNNLSQDNYLEILEPYIIKGIVDLVEWPFENISFRHWNYIRCNAYLDCIEDQKDQSQWIAFIDTDEFLFSPTGKKLNTLLSNYLNYAGVYVNRIMYGTGKVLSLDPLEKITETLLVRAKLSSNSNRTVKLIVKPRNVERIENPDQFYFHLNHAVTENKRTLQGTLSYFVSVDIFRINNYWLRDLHFFETVQSPRRKNWGATEKQLKKMESLYNDVYDDIVLTLPKI